MNGCVQVMQMMSVQGMTKNNNCLARIGFSIEVGGAHTSRTMMLEELSALLSYINRVDAEKRDYQNAIVHAHTGRIPHTDRGKYRLER